VTKAIISWMIAFGGEQVVRIAFFWRWQAAANCV
tara:strand:- start:88 stop:189 length:102 start_codon:yes stop_codon:yes gene_type:complete